MRREMEEVVRRPGVQDWEAEAYRLKLHLERDYENLGHQGVGSRRNTYSLLQANTNAKREEA